MWLAITVHIAKCSNKNTFNSFIWFSLTIIFFIPDCEDLHKSLFRTFWWFYNNTTKHKAVKHTADSDKLTARWVAAGSAVTGSPGWRRAPSGWTPLLLYDLPLILLTFHLHIWTADLNIQLILTLSWTLRGWCGMDQKHAWRYLWCCWLK